jgi:hypothetical protein
MTPQERQLVTELFDRLARLESSPRDTEAERAIADGAARAPNAVYALVQTALVQDEALRRADARIRELSGADAAAPASGGFLDSMRNAIGGHGSVPSVRPAATDSRWNNGAALGGSSGGAVPPPAQPYAAPAQSPGFGGSFLGTAAASAAGVIGGALLFNSIGSLFGGHHGGSAFGDVPPSGAPSSNSPWDSNAAGSDLSRDAGLNDIGGGRSAGLFDSSDNDDGGVDLADSGGDFGGDGGGGDSA